MTNEEFLEEVLESPCCPESFEKEYASFCKYQKLTLDTLREFARVCEKNGIIYQLAFGSLLGAVRDGGQIPWDYDVDVTVPLFEKDRLIEALDRDLNESFQFFAPGRTPGYRPTIIRVVPKGYPHQMLHVDVFFALGIPDKEPDGTRYRQKVRDLVYARRYAVQNLKEYSYSARSKLKQTALKEYYLLKYGKRATGDNSAFFSQYDIREVKNAIVLSASVGKIVFPSALFLNSTQLETREGTFSVPIDYETFLEIKYGDWKSYLPVENRVAEIEKHLRLFQWYERKKPTQK